MGWQQGPADSLGHYAFGLGSGSSWAWHSDWKPTLLCVPSQKGRRPRDGNHIEVEVQGRPLTAPSKERN